MSDVLNLPSIDEILRDNLPECGETTDEWLARVFEKARHIQFVEWHRVGTSWPENDIQILCKTSNYKNMVMLGKNLVPWRIEKYGITHWMYPPGIHPGCY